MLFSRYASPMDFMRLYIEQGRFGEFTTEIIEMDNERKREAKEKENEDKLWQAYIHSNADKSFNEWREELKQKNKNQSNNQPTTLLMTDERVADVKEQARGILRNFSPV